MKILALSLGLLAVGAASPAFSADSRVNFQIQVMTSDMQNADSVPPPTKEGKMVRVLTALEAERAFNLAARGRGHQAIVMTCSPANADWCANGFVAACDRNKGGLSSVDDGSDEGAVTCSLPQVN